MKIEDIKRVLILGSGTMGVQIGIQSAMHGYQVSIFIRNPAKNDLVWADIHERTDLIVKQKAISREEDGVTVKDLVECTGWCAKKIRSRLHDLKEDGRLESVYILRENLSGRMSSVPAYRLK